MAERPRAIAPRLATALTLAMQRDANAWGRARSVMNMLNARQPNRRETHRASALATLRCAAREFIRRRQTASNFCSV
jgi:hypothetical protein